MAIGTLAALGLGLAGAGTFLGAKSANKAANRQAESQDRAAEIAAQTARDIAGENNALTREIYDENKLALSPFQTAGMDAGGDINAMLRLLPGGDMEGEGFDRFRDSTGYKFQLGEALRGVRGGFSGAGAFQSGATLTALSDRAQGVAAGSYNDYQNSLMPRLNALLDTRRLGFGAASAQAGVGQNFVTNTTANNNSAGSATANAALMKAANNPQNVNPWGNALSLVGGGFLGMGR